MAAQIPYICGGVFLCLLDKVKKSDGPQRKPQVSTQQVVYTRKNLLVMLIQLFDHSFKTPQSDLFAPSQSDYYACKKSSGAYLPFDRPFLIKEYDNRVQQRFSHALADMRNFAITNLNVASQERLNWLGRAMLNLLKCDSLVCDNDVFFYCENGMTKREILALRRVDIAALMLAFWHFILTKRPNNTLGRETFEAWHVRNSIKFGQWQFVSTIGDDYDHEVNFTFDRTANGGTTCGGKNYMETADIGLMNISNIDELNDFGGIGCAADCTTDCTDDSTTDTDCEEMIDKTDCPNAFEMLRSLFNFENVNNIQIHLHMGGTLDAKSMLPFSVLQQNKTTPPPCNY